MSELHQQVHRARRRILLQTFFSACVWCLAISLTLAALALASTKIWFLNVDMQAWVAGWLGGSVLLGFVAAAVWTWCKRGSLSDAAIEIDRRFALRERVSSSFSLSPDEAETEVGKALVADAARRVKRIDIREKFGVQANRWAWLPLVTGALAVGLVFLPDAKPNDTSKQASAKTVEVQKVKKSATELKKKLAKKSEVLKKSDLQEASKLAKKLEKGLEELSKSNPDKKKMLVEMNNLASDLKQRRASLKGGQDLKKKLNQLKEMKLSEGPADKLAKSIQNGDFKKALEQIKSLSKSIKDAKLTPQQQEQLAKQMQQMQKKLAKMGEQHEAAKENLKEQIAKAKQQGNEAAAKKMEKKLEQKMAQDAAMKRMQKMAQQMDQIAKQMQQGNSKDALEQLEQMAQDIQSMQQEMSELQALDEMMDQLASAKDSMNCQVCDGGG